MTHNDAIRLFAKTLQNLEQWMDKAAAHAQAKSFEVDVLAQARLAPDQYAFARQVQSACDQAKYAAAYLGGKQAPSHPDTEQTFAELRAAHPEVPRASSRPSRRRTSPAPRSARSRRRGSAASGCAATTTWCTSRMPNFFFHATMAYAILRHNGVDLGKMDYIGSMPMQEG